MDRFVREGVVTHEDSLGNISHIKAGESTSTVKSLLLAMARRSAANGIYISRHATIPNSSWLLRAQSLSHEKRCTLQRRGRGDRFMASVD
jgi:hypothetical protein